MSNLELLFPDSRGGSDYGPNDPGVHHFTGKVISHLARECAQNAIDARPRVENAPAAILSFDLHSIIAGDIPEFKGALKSSWHSARKRWSPVPNEYSKLFDDAEAHFGMDRVPVLLVSDRNTRGLEGANDESEVSSSSWTRLVRSTGVANSELGAGGSFGIGKMAPFACSTLKTVFYQSFSKDGWAFQGVCRLMTHKGVDDENKQPIGFIGQSVPLQGKGYSVSRPVLDHSQSPAAFRAFRDQDELGTDIFIVGFMPAPGWVDELKVELAVNFFPAIADGIVEFLVGGYKIDKENIEKLLNGWRVSPPDSADARMKKAITAACWYFRAKNVKPLTRRFDVLGIVSLGIISGTPDEIKCFGVMPDKCFMCRSNRMLIRQPKVSSQIPIVAYLICDDKEGNELLRQMEPPTHNDWEEDRDKTPGKAAYKDLQKVYLWLRDEVAKLAPEPSKYSQALVEVADAIKSVKPGEEAGEGDSKGSVLGDLPVRKGLPRSPFAPPPRVIPGGNDRRNKSKSKGKGVKPKKKKKTEKLPEFTVLPSENTFIYRGQGIYDVVADCTDELLEGSIPGVRLYAINFSNKLEEIAFEVRDKGAKVRDGVIYVNPDDGVFRFTVATNVHMLRLDAEVVLPVAKKSS
jgi:hypothetical protein